MRPDCSLPFSVQPQPLWHACRGLADLLVSYFRVKAVENYPPSQRKRSVFCQFMSLINVLNLCPFTNVKERVEVCIWDGKRKRKITEQNHRAVWGGRDLKDHLVPTSLPWAGTPATRPGCPKPHPAWPWTLPGMGHPQLL